MADTAGKGFLYLSIANAAFLLATFIISIALTRVLSVPAFGVYGVIVSIISTVNLVFVNGFKQAVSKFVAEDHCLLPKEKRMMFFSVLGIGLALFALVFFGAPYIALALNDISLAPLIQIASFIVISYSIHSFSMGYLNGIRKFKYEAALRSAYACLKVALVIGFALLTSSIAWALWGFVAASATIAAFGLMVFKLADSRQPAVARTKQCGTKKFFGFAVSILAFVIIAQLLITVDLFMVKALSPTEIANSQAAFYTISGTMARLPYYFVLALVAVILPIISHLSTKNSISRIQFHIKSVNRYTLMAIVPMVAVVSATALPLVELLFKAKYAAAAEPLSILVFGLGFFAIFSVLATIIAGHGKPQIAMAIAFLALLLDLALNWMLIPSQGIVGAAIASTIAMAFAFAIVLAYTLLAFHAFCALKSILRILAAGTLAFAIAFFIPFTGWLLLLEYAILLLAYAAMLFISGELSQNDLNFFKEIVF